MEHKIDRHIGAASEVMRGAVQDHRGGERVEAEGHELWVMTEKMKLQMQATKMSFLSQSSWAQL